MTATIYDEYTGEQFQVELNIFETPLRIVDNANKSIAVVGGISEFQKELFKNGGTYNPNLECGAGWVFSKKNREQVEELVSIFNRLRDIRDVEITLQDKPKAKETRFEGQLLQINRQSGRTYHLVGETKLIEEELISLGCEKITDEEDMSGQDIWYFTQKKYSAVQALVRAFHKLIHK